jgi:YVTN family beta-propeller protein
MIFKITFAVIIGCIATVGLRGENTPRTALLVLAKTDQMLAIVDPSTLKVVARVPSGPDPHEVAASADGKSAYISNYGGGAYNTITIVDLTAQKAVAPVDLGPLKGPHGLMFMGGKVWFTAEAAKAIGSYDPSANKVDWILGTGQNRTHMIFVFEDLKRMITSNISSATLSIVDKTAGSRGQADWDETVVPVGRGAEGFDVSPDHKEIWAANAQDGTISIVDLSSKKVTQTLDANVKGANRLKFTPDGKLALVSSLSSPDLAIFDAASHKEMKRLKVGTGAAGIQVEPGGARAYVSSTPDDYVSVIDLKSLQVTGHIQAGKHPDGLAWAVQR